MATPLAFRAETFASRGSLCVTLHHRDVPRERIYQKMTKLLFNCYMEGPRKKNGLILVVHAGFTIVMYTMEKLS